MSDPLSSGGLLERMSQEMASLVTRMVRSSVAISGMSKGFGESTGSGFLYDAVGHVVTTGHVLEGREPPLWAAVPGCPPVEASVIGVDKVTDVAVLRLGRFPDHFLRLRECPARLGELCLAIGSPFGYYRESISLGIVSGLGRRIPQAGRRPIEDAIQTDAAINPGASGGPLVDMAGEVLGMNVAGLAPGQAQGIGFAIPAETIGPVAAELLSYGRVERGVLGVAVATRAVEQSGVFEHRLAVTAVRSNVAGDLRLGDVLRSIDGREVLACGDLFRILGRESIGRPAEVRLLRGGRDLVVTVVPSRLAEPD